MFNWLKEAFSPKNKVGSNRGDVKTKRLPGNAESTDEAFDLKNRGNAFLSGGNFHDAEKCYQAALKLDPNYAQARNNLGYVFKNYGKFDEALACAKRAVFLKPDLAEAYSLLADLASDQGRSAEALNYIKQALVLKPDHPGFRSRLALTQFDLGSEECLINFRDLIRLDPKNVGLVGDYLFALAHFEGITPDQLFDEHLQFGKKFEDTTAYYQHQNKRVPGRKLRIGFVSGDLREHALVYFIRPIFEQLFLHKDFSLIAYHTSIKEDSVSQNLKKSFFIWRNVATMNDDLLAEQIIQDEIDILLDLSGHTVGNRLLVFAKKPAPIQASWMGYPGTSGLFAMDYYFADRNFLPLEQFEVQFTEKFAYLPGSAPFLPLNSMPETNELPALKNGFITFGSFNRINKLNASVISLWAKLLKALPDAKIILGSMPNKGEFNPVIDWFANAGIDLDRISLYSRTDIDSYFRLHHQVDICLDSFPYTGGTTTSHALLMGVPTLTIAGKSPAGRQGVAILLPVGLSAFVASDKDDFVKKGLAWAENLAELAEIRKGLRARCENTSCRDPEIITDGLARALRIMWQRWCLDLPVTSFDASQATPLCQTASRTV